MASEQSPALPKLTLYWLNNSRAQRFVWLLDALGLPYDIELFQRDKDMFAPAELRKVHPLGKAPVVRLAVADPADPSRRRELVLAESGHIAQYLTEHFGRDTGLVPPRYREGQEGKPGGETDAWLRYQYYLHYAEGSLEPLMLVALILEILKSPKIPFLIRPITSGVADKMFDAFVARQMDGQLAFLDSQLETAPGGGGGGGSGGGYLCGPRLTAADILMSFPVIEARGRIGNLRPKGGKRLLDKYPRFWAYAKRLEEDPGYKAAVAKVEELQARKGKQ